MAIASQKRLPSLLVLVSVIALVSFFGQRRGLADESGASFWSPGTFANLAAVPAEPGWSFSATYFHATLMGGSNQATADTLPLFRRTTTLTVQLDADIKTNVDLAILTPGYTFATPQMNTLAIRPGLPRLICSGVFKEKRNSGDPLRRLSIKPDALLRARAAK